MATLEVLAVRDRQLDAYMRPFTAQTIGQAIRSFRDEVNRPDSEIHRHPADYELFHLGTFAENTGLITPNTSGPQQVALATNLIERRQETFNGAQQQ